MLDYSNSVNNFQINNTELRFQAWLNLYIIIIQDSDDTPFDGFPSLLNNKLDTLQQIAVKNKTSDDFNKKCKQFMWDFIFFYVII